MGAMPRQAADALARYAADWAREGPEVWPDWFEVLAATGDSAMRSSSTSCFPVSMVSTCAAACARNR